MASGNSLVIWNAFHHEPLAASAGTLDTRNIHPVIDLDATTAERACFSSIMPRHYAGGGVTVYHHIAMSSATSGCVDLAGAFERISACAQDIDTDGFAPCNALDDFEVPNTSGYIEAASFAFTDGAQMDSIAVGEGFRYKITRIGATDGAAGDMEIRFVEIKET